LNTSQVKKFPEMKKQKSCQRENLSSKEDPVAEKFEFMRAWRTKNAKL
jgi:hypothetical protein